MAAEGRTRSTSGNYKTRPGATIAGVDQREARPGDTMGQGLTSQSTWDSFFHRGEKASSRPSATPPVAGPEWAQPAEWSPSLSGDAASPDASYFDSVKPSASNPDSYVNAATQSQDGYFNNLGAPISRPQVNTGNMTVPPLPNPASLAGQSNGYDQAFGSLPTLPDMDMSFNMDDEL